MAFFPATLAYGSGQLPWLNGALTDSTVLADAAAGVGDADMELAILHMAGPRLQAAMPGTILLAAWVDFLSLADAVLQKCPSYSVEKLFEDMNRVQRLMEPSMAALSSQDPEQVEAAAIALPELMGRLTNEFASIREGARVAAARSAQIMAVAQLVEMVTMISALKMSLPRLLPPPPAAPVTLGTVLVMGSNGVMAGSQIVVSAEWVEMVRRLVQAGVISLPAASAAVRIHAGHVMMAQANGDLPQGVRDALGDGPEVRGMHETGKAGAGMAEAPRHHVLPKEHRAWFEQRGFKGPMDIDHFCVRMEPADHEAIHGGGNWRMGRVWPEEWSRNHDFATEAETQKRPDVDAETRSCTCRGADEGFQNPDDVHPGEEGMSEISAWQGNWLVRLSERVRDRGYDSVTAFAEARPTASLVELADELGERYRGGAGLDRVRRRGGEESQGSAVGARNARTGVLGASPTAGRPCWRIHTASRSRRRLARGLPTPPSHIGNGSIGPATPSWPTLRRPAGSRRVPTTSCCARSCPTRKPDSGRLGLPRSFHAPTLGHCVLGDNSRSMPTRPPYANHERGDLAEGCRPPQPWERISQAVHGGGNWRLGRTSPGEWNRMIMEALHEAEITTGRTSTRNEILNIVAKRMKDYDIPMRFILEEGDD